MNSFEWSILGILLPVIALLSAYSDLIGDKRNVTKQARKVYV